MNPFTILRQSSRLTLATAAGMALTVPANLWVAHSLGPVALGQVNFVLLCLMYATLVRPGFFEAANRELIHALGQSREADALIAQNTGFTLDLWFCFIPASALAAGAFLARDPILRAGFAIAPIALLALAAARMLTGFHAARQRFALVARLSLTRAAGKSALLLAGVWSLGAIGVLLATALSEVAVAMAAVAGPSTSLRFRADRREAGRLFRIGLPLSLGAFIYWAYRMAGSTSVAIGLSPEALGFYQFANQIVLLAIAALSDFAAVLLPVFWTEASRRSAFHDLSRESSRIAIFVMITACALANFAQAGFGPVVDALLPQFRPSVPVFGILAFDVVVLTMTFVPSLALDSAIANRQWTHWGVWGVALAMNLGANSAAIFYGLPLSAIAWNDVWIQVLVVVALFAFAGKYLFRTRREAAALYLRLALLSAVCAVVWAALPALPVADAPVNLALRLIFVLATWAAVALLMLPEKASPQARPMLMLYSDCYMFAGSENMPSILLDDAELNEAFHVSLVYRWTPWYERALRSSVARTANTVPIRLPVPPHDETGAYRDHLSFWPMWLASKLYLFFLYDLIRLYVFFRRNTPDILHVNNGGYPAAESARAAVLAARLAGVKNIILHVNSKALPRPRDPRALIEWMLDRLSASAISRYACGSRENVVRMTGRGFPIHKGLVLLNTPHPTKAHVLLEEIPRPDCALFLAVGHLQAHKGHWVLIEAARLLRDEIADDRRFPAFHVWIEGFGECRKQYEEMILDANLERYVTLLGRVSGVQNYIRACDVFVHPSYGPDDLPNVVSEALQLAKPVIGTNHVGIPSQVTPSTGLLVEPNNAPQLARAMRTLLEDARLCARLGAGARVHFERTFSYEAVVPRYRRLYQELLGAQPVDFDAQRGELATGKAAVTQPEEVSQ